MPVDRMARVKQLKQLSRPCHRLKQFLDVCGDLKESPVMGVQSPWCSKTSDRGFKDLRVSGVAGSGLKMSEGVVLVRGLGGRLWRRRAFY